ncbi:MAG: hypothetical protein N2485_01830 [bacterium]|nr:hypothetical protein [bacterium]
MDFLKRIEKNHSKYLRNYLDSKNIIKKRTKKSHVEKRLIEIKKHVEQIYLELE